MEWIVLAAVSAHGCLVVFAVDPQDEVDRKEQRLTVIADHLGFSWTGEPHLITLINLTSLRYFTFKCQSGTSWILFLKAFVLGSELAHALDFSEEKINMIRTANPDSLQDQSYALLKLWTESEGQHATGKATTFSTVSCQNQCLTDANVKEQLQF